MGIGEAEVFSERLKRELQALEAANVHAILDTEPLIDEVLKGVEAAMNCVEDMDEWLAMFNVKLRHMREDIESIETRNNKLELQSINNKRLIEELDGLLQLLKIPPEHEAFLTGDRFEEEQMLQSTGALKWLSDAMRGIVATKVDPAYGNMTARGQLKRPDHSDLRYKCRTYARLLQHLKMLDKNSLFQLRKTYCSSMNLLLRREACEFANEVRANTKAPRNVAVWLDSSAGSGQNINSADTTVLSDAYAKMLTIFIPLLVDECSFFAQFMCFEVPILAPQGGADGDDADTDDLGIMDIDEKNSKSGKNPANPPNPEEIAALNNSLQDLLDGMQEEFHNVIDWVFKIDPLRCISMHGITERYLFGPKADAAGVVRILLGDLESRISMQFQRYVDEAGHHIEKFEKSSHRQSGVLPYIPRFASLATRMEQYITGQSRDLVDQAYMKFVSIMFVTLEKVAQSEPKYADILLFENYAAFQNSLYDLANVVPTLAKFYHQASESYEHSCSRHISMIIYYQFERLFQFARKIEDQISNNVAPEEIPFQVGLSKSDLRKTLKASLSGVDKSIAAMHKKLQKNLTSEELLPSLWEKCKVSCT
ncbi:Exocyst complex component S3A, variant 2 [Stylosanthes scabra]|uniref:Exocyst complex component S3A, variant 2 n=1 Tax=Stylosanthes scabra TaxID=79078 RepID=A0ABU6WBL0_9FABA|nr:Exocyst complex component S3A, variant 2 [Stylosanthes scabra]